MRKFFNKKGFLLENFLTKKKLIKKCVKIFKQVKIQSLVQKKLHNRNSVFRLKMREILIF